MKDSTGQKHAYVYFEDEPSWLKGPGRAKRCWSFLKLLTLARFDSVLVCYIRERILCIFNHTILAKLC